MKARYLPLAGGALFLIGCGLPTRTGPMRHETRAISLDKAERVRVALNMGAGELRVSGGASQLMEADFLYNVDAWKPDVHYRSTGAFGDLTVEQPGGTHSHSGSQKYQWDLRFNNTVPLDLTVRFGAGDARMDLGKLTLRNVEMEIGAGRIDMDLRGNPKRDYGVRVRGGVGEATLRLPADVGIYAEAAGGLGEIRVRGLQRDGDHWVNDAYRDAAVRIRVDVQGGIGAVNLIAE
jgi:hypothetical protein